MKRVLFVCVGNAGRSQMAEAFFNHKAKERGLDFVASSGGTRPAGELDANAVLAMEEIGIDISKNQSKSIDPEGVRLSDKIIGMGCGVEESECPAGTYLADDWKLEDPKDMDLVQIREVRDEIARRVDDLLDELNAPA